jgi:hypothetical protein
MIHQDRLVVLIFVVGVPALAAFAITDIYYPQYYQFALLLDATAFAVIIGGYFYAAKISALEGFHLLLKVLGFALPIDIFYTLSNREDTLIQLDEWGLRWELTLPLLESIDLSGIFPNIDGASETWYIALRFWGLWNERIGRGDEVALKAGLPFWRSNSEEVMVSPNYDVPPEQHAERFGVLPTFEVRFTSYGDSSVDMEPFNEAMREIAARSVLRRANIPIPEGMKAFDMMKMVKKEMPGAVKQMAEKGRKAVEVNASTEGSQS